MEKSYEMDIKAPSTLDIKKFREVQIYFSDQLSGLIPQITGEVYKEECKFLLQDIVLNLRKEASLKFGLPLIFMPQVLFSLDLTTGRVKIDLQGWLHSPAYSKAFNFSLGDVTYAQTHGVLLESYLVASNVWVDFYCVLGQGMTGTMDLLARFGDSPGQYVKAKLKHCSEMYLRMGGSGLDLKFNSLSWAAEEKKEAFKNLLLLAYTIYLKNKKWVVGGSDSGLVKFLIPDPHQIRISKLSLESIKTQGVFRDGV